MGKKQDKKDLPRGLQIDTTTGPFDFDEEEKIMVPKKKPVKAGLGKMVTKLFGKVFGEKSSTVNPTPGGQIMGLGKTPLTALYQKATKQKTAKMNVGGEVEVTKGGDYIKDLL